MPEVVLRVKGRSVDTEDNKRYERQWTGTSLAVKKSCSDKERGWGREAELRKAEEGRR